ncbi:MAG: hypothetical protein HY762_04625 [Planctomycetes bacterium]|nr:hypothetical protein [Planctomycetota bacterium]
MRKGLFIGIVIISLIGCASPKGFHRDKLRENLSQQTSVTDEDIKKVLDLKPQLPKPFKLGIYFKEPQRPEHYYWNYTDWHWNEMDRDLMVKIGERKKEKGIVSENIYISASVANSKDVKSIRYGAAQHGVDAVLVINGTAETDRYNNACCSLYFLIVPTAFIPGTVVDALFLSNASLWDVRNGFLYLSYETEATSHITGAALTINEKYAVDEAKAVALPDLAQQIEKHLTTIEK